MKKKVAEWLGRFGVAAERLARNDELTGEECVAYSLGLAAVIGTGKLVVGPCKIRKFIAAVCAR
jgi:hypothetical protein